MLTTLYATNVTLIGNALKTFGLTMMTAGAIVLYVTSQPTKQS